MPIQSLSSHFYKVGGSLGFEHPSYVTRTADHELLEALNARQFCYVFNCRQMGKSSLRVRAVHLLEQQGMSCASIDMTLLGSHINPRQWYGGIMTQLFQGFSLFGSVNLKVWLQERRSLSPVQQLGHFISEVILPQTGDRPLFIFIDEIDKILSLDFSVDDFFALIRFFYNQRAENSDFARLTFALFGVATPSDLIQDKTQTLFNIGQAIELRGFSLDDVSPLVAGIADYCDRPLVVLQEILDWTGGQPFLTQKLCQWVRQSQSVILLGQESQWIEKLVRSQIIENWETQDEPVHLKTIRDRLLHSTPNIARQLGLYQRILNGKFSPMDGSPEQTELRLSGLVVQQESQLQVYNRIYAEIFDRSWIEQQLAQLRPYAESLVAWDVSQRQDESRLLRGQALKDALRWAESKNLSPEDYQFLAASQAVDKRTALEQERRRNDVARLELELIAEQKAKETLSDAYIRSTRRLRIASAILVCSVFGAAIAAGWLGYVLYRQQDIHAKSLEWAGKSATSQFEFSQIEALRTAMEAGKDLQSMVSDDQPLQDYPTAEPITSLQSILDRIRERNHLVGHQAPINGIAMSPNGERIATASRDGTAKIWTLQGTELLTLNHEGDVYGVSFSSDSQRLATASKDGTVKVWSLFGELLFTLPHTSDVYSVQFSRDGKWIATASHEGVAQLWTSQGVLVRSFLGHRQAIYSVSFNPDSSQLVTASRDGTAKVWGLDGRLVRSLSSQDTLYSARFSPDGKFIATVGQAGLLQLWEGDKLRRSLPGHQGAIYDVDFDPSGQFLATASEDETIKIWTIQGQELTMFQGYQGAVYDANFSPDGTMLTTASHEKEARIWDFTQFPLTEQQSQAGEVTALRMSQTGELVTAFVGGMVMVQSPTGQILKRFKVGSASIYDIALNPIDNTIIIAFDNGQVQVTDFQGKMLKQFQAHDDIIYSVTVHPKGNRIVTAARDQRIRFWSLAGKLEQEVLAHDDAVYDVAYSPDGQWLATASSDKTVKVWTLDGQVHAILTGHQGAVHQVEFSPDSDALATASTDETARVWSLEGKEILRLEHDFGLVFRVGFRADGVAIATGSKDGTISLWDLEGTLLDQLKSHQSLVMDLLFSNQNQLISIAQDEGQAKIWPKSSAVSERLDALLKEGCQWLSDYTIRHPKWQSSVCAKKPPERFIF